MVDEVGVEIFVWNSSVFSANYVSVIVRTHLSSLSEVAHYHTLGPKLGALFSNPVIG